METTKICKKCGRELPLECFSKDRTRKDGLQRMCKECNKQYRAEHTEHIKQYNNQYRADNAEYFKQWRAENPEYFKQWRSTIEGYARQIRKDNLREDRKYGRIAADEDPLPSVEEYIRLLQQVDYYDKKEYPFNEMGVDRIDNSKPHTLDNVVPCSTAHNVQRGTKSFEEFKAIFIKNGNT